MIKKKEIYNNKWYHATTNCIAKVLFDSKIDCSKGGGELGQGFYMGNRLNEAKAWAYHKNRKVITEFSIVTFIFEPWIKKMKFKYLGKNTAKKYYEEIKKKKQTRSYKFSLDFINSKVVGVEKYGFYQLKWESKSGETFLNNVVKKELI